MYIHYRRRKERSSSSSASHSEGGEEEEEECWVEKSIKHDGEDVFVGPVPEIRVQATATKKE